MPSSLLSSRALAAPPRPPRCRRARAAAASAAAPQTQTHTSPALQLQVTVTALPASRRRLRCARTLRALSLPRTHTRSVLTHSCALRTPSAELPLAVLQASHAAVLAELTAGSTLPGFRKGAKQAAPALLVAAVTPPKFRAACVEHLLQAVIEDVGSPVAATAFSESLETLTPMAALQAAFSGGPSCEPTGPAALEIEVDVVPEVAWRLPYSGLVASVPPELTPAQLEAAGEAALLARLRDESTLRVVPGRGLRAGDVARLDIRAFNLPGGGGGDAAGGEDGPPIASLQLAGIMFDTDAQGPALPGFVAACEAAGLRPGGGDAVFTLPLPPTWRVEALRGVAVRWRVGCSELFERQLPDVSPSAPPLPAADEAALAARLRPGAATLAAARAGICGDAAAEAAAARAAARREAVLAALVAAADVALPRSLLDNEGRAMYGAQLLARQRAGTLSPAAVAQLSGPTMVAQFCAARAEEIAARARAALALRAVAHAEGLAADDGGRAEAAAEAAAGAARSLAAAAAPPGAAPAVEVDTARVREQADEEMLQERALEWVVARAVLRDAV